MPAVESPFIPVFVLRTRQVKVTNPDGNGFRQLVAALFAFPLGQRLEFCRFFHFLTPLDYQKGLVESVLEELLETLGLHEGIHFEKQSTLRDEDGNSLCSEETGSKMRPDVIVHLDKTKDVIVDSKVLIWRLFRRSDLLALPKFFFSFKIVSLSSKFLHLVQMSFFLFLCFFIATL